MKPKKPTTTTTADPFVNYEYDENHYIYGDLSEKGNFPDDEFTRNFDSMEFMRIALLLKDIYNIAAYVGFFINLIHLFILTRKELRSNLVYIVMIGICICDLIQCFGNMFEQFLLKDIVYTIEWCGYSFRYFHTFTNLMVMTSQVMSRRCSGLLGLFIASFRAFSVIFPMSGLTMLKIRTGILIIFLFAVICSAWSFCYFSLYSIDIKHVCTIEEFPSYIAYELNWSKKSELKFRLIDGYIGITICVLYIFVAAALVFELRQTKQRRKNLKNDRPNNTSWLVVAMAISVFFSEIVYGAVFLLSFHVLNDYIEQEFVSELDVLGYTCTYFNSASHCFICFFMSSQYRETVKKLVWRGKEKKKVALVAVVESSAHPTNTTIKSSKDSSKKTY